MTVRMIVYTAGSSDARRSRPSLFLPCDHQPDMTLSAFETLPSRLRVVRRSLRMVGMLPEPRPR